MATNEALAYISRIRNKRKRAYAEAVYRAYSRGVSPPDFKQFDLTYMGAQAVRLEIDRLMPRRPNPRPRVGTKKPNRASSATGRAPTKRLVSRRKRNSRKGYFPNPAKKRAGNYARPFKLVMETKSDRRDWHGKTPRWEVHHTRTIEPAKYVKGVHLQMVRDFVNYARSFAKRNPGIGVRVRRITL